MDFGQLLTPALLVSLIALGLSILAYFNINRKRIPGESILGRMMSVSLAVFMLGMGAWMWHSQQLDRFTMIDANFVKVNKLEYKISPAGDSVFTCTIESRWRDKDGNYLTFVSEKFTGSNVFYTKQMIHVKIDRNDPAGNNKTDMQFISHKTKKGIQLLPVPVKKEHRHHQKH